MHLLKIEKRTLKICIFTLLFFFGSEYADAGIVRRAPNNLGLTSYWTFNDGAGSKATDSSGSGYTGTLNGAVAVPTWTNGKFGKALLFDGTEDYVSGLPGWGRDENYTISMWFKSNSNHDGGLMDFEYFLDGSNFVAFKNSVVNNGKVDCWAYSYNAGVRTDFACGNTSYTINEWHNYVFVWTGGTTPTVSSYLDGVYVGQDNDNSLANFDWNASDMTATNRVGWICGYKWFNNCTSWNSYFNGYIDDVRTYSRALTAAEIQALYTNSTGVIRKGVSNNGLVGYWKLDDGAGTKAGDSSGNENTGTLTGSTWVNGKLGKALSMGGSTDYVDVGVGAGSLDQLGNTFTISAWIKTPTPTARMTIFSTGYSGTGPMFGTSANTPGGLEVYYPGIYVAYTGASLLAADTWQHVVYTRSGTGAGTHAFYINGVSQALASDTASNFSDTAVNKYIGYRASVLFNGQIDDVRVYRRALSASEVATMYGSGQTTRKEVSNLNLIGKWNFDEGTGTLADDSSGNGYNGTLTNAPTWTKGKVGKGLSFDGLNDYVTVASNSSLKYQGGNFSFAGWIYINSTETSGGYFFSKPWNGSGQYNYYLYTAANSTVTLNLHGASQDGLATLAELAPGVWYHIAFTLDSSRNIVLYVNGVSNRTATHGITDWTPSSGDANLPLAIGTLYPYGEGWGGVAGHAIDAKMDDIRVYGRTLTAGEIRTLYDIGR